MRSMLTPMVKNLLIANAVVFVLGILLKNLYVEQYLVLYYFGSSNFQPAQFITYMFVHANFFHLFGNMISLFFFGPMLEAYWGAKRFLFYWVFCGIGGALIYSATHYYEVKQLETARELFVSEPSYEYFVSFERKFGQEILDLDYKEALEEHPEDVNLLALGKSKMDEVLLYINESSSVRGASGAVFGILMAFGLLFPNTELMLLFFPMPIKAKYFVLIYGAFELFMGVARVPGDNIAHFAHLGGAFFGFILVKYWQKQRNTFY